MVAIPAFFTDGITESLDDQTLIPFSTNLIAGAPGDPTANAYFGIGAPSDLVNLTDPGSIPITINLPIALPSVQLKAGFVTETWEQDWYERIHMLPAEIDVGAVVTDQSRTFDVWNAHRRVAQFLSAITPALDTGITLVEPAGKAVPTVFAPLEILTYQLDIDSEGPATIQATYTFDWPPGSTPPDASGFTVFSLLGFRVVLFPFPPTWRNPVTERIEYATDVLAADDSTEQRMRLRKFPRKFFEFEVSSIPDPEQGKDLAEMTQILDALLWGFQARVYALPVWTDCVVLNTDLPSGSLIIPVDPANLDFEVGKLVVVFKSVDNFEVLNVDTLPGGQINLVSATTKSFTAPVRIYPAHTARMRTRQDVRRPFDQFSFGNFIFQVDDNHEVPTPVDLVTTFKSDVEGNPIPVLQDRPERSVDLTHDFERKAFVLDYQTGIRTVDDNIGSPIEIKTFRWVFGDRVQHNTWKEMILSRSGRLKPIWVPSWHDDLQIVAVIGAVDTTITIRDVGYTTLYQSQPGRNHLQILLKDGTRIYVGRVISSVSGPGVDEETLTLDTAVGTAISDLTTIAKVSFMGLFRLDADIFEISWPAAINSIIELRFRLLPVETDEAS